MNQLQNFLIIISAKYLLLVPVVVAVIFFFKKSRSEKKKILILAAIVFPLSYILAKILAHFYYDPRPFVFGRFAPLIPHAADNGFPSDHTLLAVAIAVVIFHFSRRSGLFLFLVAILIGAARVFAGVHHFTDIAGSLAIVLVVYLFTTKLLLEPVWRRIRKTV